MRFFKKKQNLSGNTPGRYSAKTKRRTYNGSGIVFLGSFIGLFGLLVAFHAVGQDTHAHAKIVGFVSKIVTKSTKTLESDSKSNFKSDPSCLSVKTYDPNKCKRYGSSETR